MLPPRLRPPPVPNGLDIDPLVGWLADLGVAGELRDEGGTGHYRFGPGPTGGSELRLGPLVLLGDIALHAGAEPWLRWALEVWTQALSSARAIAEDDDSVQILDIARSLDTAVDAAECAPLANPLMSWLHALVGATGFAIYVLDAGSLVRVTASEDGAGPESIRLHGPDGHTIAGTDGAPGVLLGSNHEDATVTCCVASRGGEGVPTTALIVRRRDDAGAWEPRWERRLQRAVEILSPVVRSLYTAETSRALAARDTLTGLATRRHFMEEMDREIARSRREGRPLTLLVLDVDLFKRINDTWGHAAGDLVLRHIGDVMRRGTRACDCIGRLGGDEFVTLLPATDLSAGTLVASRLCDALHSMRISWRGERLAVSVSIGAATWDGATSPEDFLDRADSALYAAKGAGRAQVATTSGRVQTLAMGTITE